jgi:MFS transporter, PAT family, beta-lactamase induction signal transducer AmpG
MTTEAVPAGRIARWRAAATVYFEPRVLAILFLGFSAGLPLALTGQTLSVRLTEVGVDKTTIGLFALVGLPYVLKFLWAPAFDAVPLPWLTRRLGRRRGWLIATQIALMLAVLGLGAHDPTASPWITALLALLVAFCSASQDVVIDAFRVESLRPEENAAALANYTAGYRVAMLTSSAGAIFLSAGLQGPGVPLGVGWFLAYAVMAALVAIGVLTVLACREPIAPERHAVHGWAERVNDALVRPFVDFAQRPGWLLVLGFILLYKFGDAFAGVMTAPFVLSIGFSKTDYASVVKLYGFAATLIGGFLGGALYSFAGNLRSLWICGVLQAVSNLMFAWQATVGAQTSALILTITAENLTGGMGSVVFLAYISGLCRNREFTATQYALLSALAAVGRVVLSSTAGWFADHMDWVSFFLLTTVAAVPGLVALAWLAHRGWIESEARAP